jgi:hypothetical protein
MTCSTCSLASTGAGVVWAIAAPPTMLTAAVPKQSARKLHFLVCISSPFPSVLNILFAWSCCLADSNYRRETIAFANICGTPIVRLSHFSYDSSNSIITDRNVVNHAHMLGACGVAGS